jgi:hypothetical protein
MKGHYAEKLKEHKCWRTNEQCVLDDKFLKSLYSWSELNPLDPMLVWKVCDPCYYEKNNPLVKS